MLPVFKQTEFTQCLEQHNVTYGFYGRQGGVSTGVYDSLNCGVGSGDDETLVLQNRAIIARDLDAQAETVRGIYQEHSSQCVLVNKGDDPCSRPYADALITGDVHLPVGVLTADCTPVLFFGCQDGRKAIAAAHAGWKGALYGVLDSVVKKMYELYHIQPQNIVACTGPNIKQSSYQVGEEFFQTFLQESQAYDMFFTQDDSQSYYFDLTGFCVRRLQDLSVGKIVTMPQDTYTQKQDFFSYRRTTHNKENHYGRQLSAICLLD